MVHCACSLRSLDVSQTDLGHTASWCDWHLTSLLTGGGSFPADYEFPTTLQSLSLLGPLPTGASLDHALPRLPHLTSVTLRGGNLRMIPRSLGLLPLHTLCVECTPLNIPPEAQLTKSATTDPALALSVMSRLKTLALESCSLCEVPKAVAACTGLLEVRLSGNPLVDAQPLALLPALARLNINGCVQLRTLPLLPELLELHANETLLQPSCTPPSWSSASQTGQRPATSEQQGSLASGASAAQRRQLSCCAHSRTNTA